MADPTRRSTRFSMRSKQLGQLLVESGDVDSGKIARALKIQEQQGGLLGQILQQNGDCTDAAIAQALLKQVQVTDVRCDELAVPPEVSTLVPRVFCENEKLCPFERIGNLLCVVMGNPLNRKAISQIEEKTRLKVKSFKAVWPKIYELIERTYGEGAAQVQDATDGLSLEDPGSVPAVDDLATGAQAQVEDAGLDLAMPEDIQPPMEVPTAPVKPKRRPEAPAPQAKVIGMDNLDENSAELIQTNRRGLSSSRSKRIVDDEPPKPKVAKVAKVNVDLDSMDFTQGEVVKAAVVEEDGWEEIDHKTLTRPEVREAGENVYRLASVPDSEFYEEGHAPEERTEELTTLRASIPSAEVIAQSIGDYRSQERAKVLAREKPAAVPANRIAQKASPVLVNRPVELQPAPTGAMAAVMISEAEFRKISGELGEDPVGEWDWNYYAPGPVPVQVYEEN